MKPKIEFLGWAREFESRSRDINNFKCANFELSPHTTTKEYDPYLPVPISMHRCHLLEANHLGNLPDATCVSVSG